MFLYYVGPASASFPESKVQINFTDLGALSAESPT